MNSRSAFADSRTWPNVVITCNFFHTARTLKFSLVCEWRCQFHELQALLWIVSSLEQSQIAPCLFSKWYSWMQSCVASIFWFKIEARSIHVIYVYYIYIYRKFIVQVLGFFKIIFLDVVPSQPILSFFFFPLGSYKFHF